MYIYNEALLPKITKMMGITKKTLCIECGIDQGSYQFHINSGNLPLQELVDICNYTKMPISRFIMLDDEQPESEPPFVADDEWIPIVNDSRLIGHVLRLRTKSSIAKACMSLGVCEKTYRKYFNGVNDGWKVMKVQDFLKMINNAGLSAGEFLIDENRPITQPATTESAADDDVTATALKTSVLLLNENERLRSRIRSLEAEVKELHRLLLHRDIDYRDVAMNDNDRMMAAEELG